MILVLQKSTIGTAATWTCAAKGGGGGSSSIHQPKTNPKSSEILESLPEGAGSWYPPNSDPNGAPGGSRLSIHHREEDCGQRFSLGQGRKRRPSPRAPTRGIVIGYRASAPTWGDSGWFIWPPDAPCKFWKFFFQKCVALPPSISKKKSQTLRNHRIAPGGSRLLVTPKQRSQRRSRREPPLSPPSRRGLWVPEHVEKQLPKPRARVYFCRNPQLCTIQ
jgi:hypothetical protein